MTSAYLILDTRRPNKNGEFRIKIRIVHEGNPREISLQYSCKENQWTGDGVKNYSNSGRVNAYLTNELNKARKVIANNLDKLEGMSVEKLRRLITNYDPDGTRNRSNMTLGDWSDMLVSRTRKANKHGTANWYSDAVRATLKFNGKDLAMSDIDYSFLKEFETDHLSRGGSINGFAVYMRSLRSILNKANVEFDECANYPFQKYKIKEQKTRKRAVKIDVINAIRELEIDQKKSVESLADWNARNYLLFIFNNRGMNFIDLAKLKRDQITEAVFEKKKLISGRLIYTRSKNNKEFSIKLTAESIAILNSYDVFHKSSEDTIFPIGYTNTQTGRDTYRQKRGRCNKRFNKLARMAGLDVKITSYVLRHSWASIAKSKGVSKDIIGESLGHDDPKVTEVYLENFENEVLDDANELIVG
ncbi:MAG: site-specific integrase [Flavobacteriales bacterium]|nr:site-specific integrase [Flavobacteriales bacterium]